MQDDSQLGPILKVKVALVRACKRVLDWRVLVIWCACSFIASYTGPFGTYKSYTLVELLGTWLVLLAAAILSAYVLDELFSAFLSKLSFATRMFAFVFTMSALLGPLIDVLLTTVLGNPETETPSRFELSLYSLGAISFILVIRQMVASYLDENRKAEGDKSFDFPPASLPPHSRLAKRLNIPQGVKISQITAKGHFVEVHTSSDILRTRMRFSDAVAELDGVFGLTVHRSHWVHYDSIQGWVPCAKKPFIVLNNGNQVPISKTYVANVRDAGLLEISPEDLECDLAS